MTRRLRSAASAVDACDGCVEVLGEHTNALIATLLHVHDRLRCVAATGSWQVFSAVLLGRGVVGRVYASGKTAVVVDPDDEADFIRLGPDIAAEICAPITDRAGQPVGALNVEWTGPVDVAEWQPVIEEIARLLGARVDELGGPPAESVGEKLLRYSLSLSTATTEAEVLTRCVEAARDISGLSSAVLLGFAPDGVVVRASSPRPLDRPIIDRLAKLDHESLLDLAERVGRHGASFTLGDPDDFDSHGYEALTTVGVRTMISTPVGPGAAGGVLLTLDDTTSRPDPARVSLLELLAAQAWTCLDRIATLIKLHERASSDPLTGLRHQGPFGERLAEATPGKTALLAIDVDLFKVINDTYGHAAGDRALVDLAKALAATLRLGDELYRVGGDEFVAVVDVPSAGEALAVADRLIAAARRTGRTISIGVALRGEAETAEDTLHRADTALYQVKRQGRDGIKLAR
ncbi:diguanylate cyclase (GGDEF)-like protein [Allocatelliglobosispora scoriae]|uniref:Diguanylate cyclase (GGDEF)-like protein n=1 Tax=Allocatelliglobosispora scoriae TaxID=643052 RepID=A0A841BSK0_9ACTN|nr:diguanylate cyclase (GGDEF)-like protein [Allocatelliglobosispora scoriae]